MKSVRKKALAASLLQRKPGGHLRDEYIACWWLSWLYRETSQQLQGVCPDPRLALTPPCNARHVGDNSGQGVSQTSHWPPFFLRSLLINPLGIRSCLCLLKGQPAPVHKSTLCQPFSKGTGISEQTGTKQALHTCLMFESKP